MTHDGAEDINLDPSGFIQFECAGSERARIDSSGRLGIGTSSPLRALHVSGAGDTGLMLQTTNAVDNKEIWEIQAAGDGSNHANLIFRSRTNAGTGGTEALRITNDGKVGIGTTGPGALLDARGAVRLGNLGGGDGTTAISSTNGLYIGTNNGTTATTVVPLQIGAYPAAPGYTSSPDHAIVLNGWSGGGIYHNAIVNRKGRDLSFHTAITGNTFSDTNERVRIDSSGRLLIGTSSNLNSNARCIIQSNTDSATGAAALDLRLGTTRPAAADTSIGLIRFSSTSQTAASNVYAQINAASDGASSSDADIPGRLVFSTTADGASSPTERMRIDSSGQVLIGKTSGTITTVGKELYAGYGSHTASGNEAANFNRLASDGTVIGIYQDSNLEGTISVSGTTVSYNGAHLSRWSQLPSGADRTEILRGSVLSNIDEMCEWGDEENEQLNRMKVSDVEGDKNVSGVFQAWDDDDDTYINDFYCAMTGDFIIRIAEGVTVERGDLLMSAGDGTAKPQDDDIIRSKTIAKVTSTNVSCTYEDGSYCVPCVLMAC